MSDVIDDKKQPDTPQDFDSTDPNSVEEPIGNTDTPQETPLPDFSTKLVDDNAESELVKGSDAPPANLNQFLTTQRTGEIPTVETRDIEAEANPGYRVSPASANISQLTPPSLESNGEESEDGEGKESGKSGWKTTWAIIREVGETVLLTLIIFLIIQMVIRNFRVVGTSMVGNLHDGQYLIIDKLTYNPWLQDYLGIGGPQRGDVIVFEPPRHPDEDYVKRVIGLEGEEVQVIKGQVFINGQPLEEPFEPKTGSYTMPQPVLVPEGSVFVLGDNRNNSNDSHNWGPLPTENIVGRAWVSYWPPELWGTIPRDIPSEEATLKHFIGEIIPNANAQGE